MHSSGKFPAKGRLKLNYNSYNADRFSHHLIYDMAEAEMTVANALIDGLRDLTTPCREHSVAVKSQGAYGFDPIVLAAVPAHIIKPGSSEVLKDLLDGRFCPQFIVGKTDQYKNREISTAPIKTLLVIFP